MFGIMMDLLELHRITWFCKSYKLYLSIKLRRDSDKTTTIPNMHVAFAIKIVHRNSDKSTWPAMIPNMHGVLMIIVYY